MKEKEIKRKNIYYYKGPKGIMIGQFLHKEQKSASSSFLSTFFSFFFLNSSSKTSDRVQTWTHLDDKRKKMAQHLPLARFTKRLFTPHDRRQNTPKTKKENYTRPVNPPDPKTFICLFFTYQVRLSGSRLCRSASSVKNLMGFKWSGIS